MAINEQVCSRTVYQLKTTFCSPFPVVGRYSFTDDPSRYGNELVVDIGYVQLVDFLANLFNKVFAARL